MIAPDRSRLTPEFLVDVLGDRWPADLLRAAADVLADPERRFPSGTLHLPADLTRAIQRERLLAGMLGAAAELGHGSTNVKDVVDRAGVSRPTFYQHFSNKDDCFLVAFEMSAARMRDRVETAAARGGGVWRDRLRLGLGALLDFAAAEPDAARMVIIEGRAGSQEAARRHLALIDHFTSCIDAGARALLPDPADHSPVTAAGVVGGIESLLYARLNKDEVDDLPTLLPPLMYFAVGPYEGHRAACEELGSMMTPV